MASKVIIEVEPQHEGIVRQALALAQELEHLALSAEDGHVFDACENALLHKGRKLQSQILSQAVAQRILTAEKKGPRFDSVTVGAPSKMPVPKTAN